MKTYFLFESRVADRAQASVRSKCVDAMLRSSCGTCASRTLSSTRILFRTTFTPQRGITRNCRTKTFMVYKGHPVFYGKECWCWNSLEECHLKHWTRRLEDIRWANGQVDGYCARLCLLADFDIPYRQRPRTRFLLSIISPPWRLSACLIGVDGTFWPMGRASTNRNYEFKKNMFIEFSCI